MNQAKSTTWVVWWAVVVAFSLISLWPIWTERFPPLQDYPEHLLHAHMLFHRHDPRFDYNRNFEFHLSPIYAAFFGVTGLFARFLPIEAAGKTALSLYIGLVAALVMRLARRWEADDAPWGLLLFFPLAFNQQYFQGNINYCYSMPLLLLALVAANELSSQSLRFWPLLGHFALLLLLLFTHPLAFLVYLGLALASAAFSWRDRARGKRSLIPPLTGLSLFLLWYALRKWAGTGPEHFGEKGLSFHWEPLRETIGFTICMFTGLRWHDGIDALTTTLWIIALVLLAGAWIVWSERGSAQFRRHLLFFGLTIAAIFVLPFSVHDSADPDVRLVSFFNWRLAAVAYFLLGLLAGQVRFRGRWAALFVACVCGLLLLSVQKQQRISQEIRSIEGVIDNIPPDSRILPLVFNRSTPELDAYYFDMHLHVHNYYHLLVGGGLSPYFFKAPLHPVHLRSAVNLPAPGEYHPQEFRWEQHADGYEYFLVRGAPETFLMYMSGTTDPVVKSGEWLLLKRKDSTAPPASPAGTRDLLP